ncbi:MAG TPA: GntR family transcriptional regulator [Steroidobacteraceae bacterium]|nr:GntR family transcriptional regulator [Steroidobacteraceae bacterium]
MSTTEGAAFKRTCMRDRIRDVLVGRILDGTYAAGTQLKELSLAREFNVSQTPIREALRELEGSGLVTNERFRGTRVRGADFTEMRESYELRTMLEVRSARLAAPYSAELLADLEEKLRLMEIAVAADDPERYIDAALSFHRRLVAASGNRTFLSVWDSLLWDVRGRIALRRRTEKGGCLGSLISMHTELLSRLRAQNTEEAAEQVGKILHDVADSFAPG